MNKEKNYDFLKNQINKIVVIHGIEEIDGTKKLPARKKDRTLYLYNGTITNQNLREILQNELVIEFDSLKECVIGSDEFKKNRTEAVEWINKLKTILINQNVQFYITDHVGKSPHIRFQIDGLQHYNKNYAGYYKLKYVEHLLKKLNFSSENLLLDRGLLTSKHKLISLEHQPHWKAKYGGQTEKIIFENSGTQLSLNVNAMQQIIDSFDVDKKQEFDSISIENVNQNKLKEFWKKYYTEGRRNHILMAFGGLCRKKDLNQSSANNLLKELLHHVDLSHFYDNTSNELSYCFKMDRESVAVFHFIENSFEDHGTVIQVYNDLLECFDSTKKIELMYFTKHLPNFEVLDKALGLHGEEYKVVLKALYYSLVGLSIKDCAISFGSVKFDTRISLIFIMNSGKGKNNIKQVYKNLSSIFQVSEALSLHPEQLIGKVVKGKKDEEPKVVEGYFHSDVLLLDESRELFKSMAEKHSEIRGFTCVALDPLGNNIIHKRMVDFGSKYPLKYPANCTAILFTQPITINAEVFECGFTRRFLIIGLAGFSDDKFIYNARLNGESRDAYITQFNSYLEGLNHNGEWSFVADVKDALEKYCGLLNDFGLCHSKKGFYYLKKIYGQTLLDMLFKFSCISATYSWNSRNVTVEDVERAYIDLFELLNSTLDCINNNSNFFYVSDIKYQELQTLNWLYDSNAISPEKTKLSIKDLKEKICNIYIVEFTRAEHIYFEIVKKGYLVTKKGQHDSKVWLSPNGVKLIEDGFNKINGQGFYDEYLRLCNKYSG